jgi:hypothetical protein
MYITYYNLSDEFQSEKIAIALGIFSSILSGGAVIGLLLGRCINENFEGRPHSY